MRFNLLPLYCPPIILGLILTHTHEGNAGTPEPCLENTIVCMGTHHSTEPTFSISWDEIDTNNFGQASYDLVNGVFNSVTVTELSQPSAGASVLAQDEYEILGVEQGEVLNFEAVLSIVASRTALSSACALLSQDQKNQASFCANIGNNIETSITIPVSIVIGDPFQLLFQLSTSGTEGGSSSISGMLSPDPRVRI